MSAHRRSMFARATENVHWSSFRRPCRIFRREIFFFFTRAACNEKLELSITKPFRPLAARFVAGVNIWHFAASKETSCHVVVGNIHIVTNFYQTSTHTHKNRTNAQLVDMHNGNHKEEKKKHVAVSSLIPAHGVPA